MGGRAARSRRRPGAVARALRPRLGRQRRRRRSADPGGMGVEATTARTRGQPAADRRRDHAGGHREGAHAGRRPRGRVPDRREAGHRVARGRGTHQLPCLRPAHARQRPRRGRRGHPGDGAVRSGAHARPHTRAAVAGAGEHVGHGPREGRPGASHRDRRVRPGQDRAAVPDHAGAPPAELPRGVPRRQGQPARRRQAPRRGRGRGAHDPCAGHVEPLQRHQCGDHGPDHPLVPADGGRGVVLPQARSRGDAEAPEAEPGGVARRPPRASAQPGQV